MPARPFRQATPLQFEIVTEDCFIKIMNKLKFDYFWKLKETKESAGGILKE